MINIPDEDVIWFLSILDLPLFPVLSHVLGLKNTTRYSEGTSFGQRRKLIGASEPLEEGYL